MEIDKDKRDFRALVAWALNPTLVNSSERYGTRCIDCKLVCCCFSFQAFTSNFLAVFHQILLLWIALATNLESLPGIMARIRKKASPTTPKQRRLTLKEKNDILGLSGDKVRRTFLCSCCGASCTSILWPTGISEINCHEIWSNSIGRQQNREKKDAVLKAINSTPESERRGEKKRC